MRGHIDLITILLTLAAVVGCGKEQTAAQRAGREIGLGDTFNQIVLEGGTARLLTQTYVDIVAVSGEAARQTKIARVREDSLVWRINAVGTLDRLRGLDDPRLRFAALWTLVTEFRLAFTEGPDRARFQDVQQLYVDCARKLEQQVIALAYDSFPDDAIDRARPVIVERAKTTGIGAWFVAGRSAGGSELSAILSVPLAPISGLQGVRDTPSAINRFTDEATEIGHIVGNLPERSRWQLELLMLEAENAGVVAAALREIAETRKQLTELSQSVQKLPEQTQTILAQAEKMQPALGENLTRIEASLKTADQTSKSVSQTIETARGALTDVSKSAAAVQSAAAEIRGLAGDLSDKLGDQDASKDNSVKPQEIGAAAVEVRTAAAEVRGLIADLQKPAYVPALDRSAGVVRGLIWQATLSAAGLILLGVLAVGVMRVLARRAESRR